MRLLHVEDNVTDADIVAQALRRTAEGIHIDLVYTLDAARNHLTHAEQYDAALVDLQLPDGSGLDLLAEIRERQLPLPVVLLTGSGDQQAAITALQSGADDYIPKDIDAYAQLATTLSAACRRFAERRRTRPRTLHVLYAEHNAADIDLSRRHLAKHAPYIRLTVVPDAMVALSLLPLDPSQACDYDVLLLDYRLPGVDALDAVRKIRNERGLDIPIVVVSGQGSEIVAARSIKLGVDDFIAKHGSYLHELGPTLEKVHRQHALLNEQQELEKTSQHLAYMLEASPVVLYMLDCRNDQPRATWVSANITRLFGFSEEQALEPNWWNERVHPDDLADAQTARYRMGEQGVVRHDYRILDSDGRVHWIRDEIRELADRSPAHRTLLGAWHDITNLKRAEQVQQTRIAALDSLVGGTPLHDVLRKLAADLERIMPDMRVSIRLYDPRQDCLMTAAAPSLPASFNDAVDGLKPEVGRGTCGTAAALGEIVIVEDVNTHPSWKPYTELTEKAGVRACWSVPFKDEDDTLQGTFGIYHDEPRSPEQGELRLIEEFARIAGLAVQRANTETSLRQAGAVFDSTQEGVVITDLMSRIIAVNRAYTDITGYAESEVIGCTPAILQSGRQDEAFYQAMWASLLEMGHWQGEIWNRRRNGEIYPQLLTISTVRDSGGNPKNYVGVMTDISQIKQSEANLERLAHYDPLTDLPNRLLIHSRLGHTLKQARREEARVAVLFLDLDRFKNVNDSLGHPVGDTLLQALTRRLSERLRDEDSFGRLGGDEFLIILNHANRPESAAMVARQLIGLLEEPFTLPNGNEIYVGASIGISIFPQDGDEASTLIQHADAAMSQAKDHGRNTFCYYTPALTEAANRRIEMESRLRRAIAQNEFVLHYQPQVHIDSGMIVGCEVLLRWNDPHKGLVPPADFIPLAEETGLIVPLGNWLLDAAAAQFRRWIDQGLPDFCLSINLSGRQLQQADIVAQLGEIAGRHRLPTGRLKLELTESVIMGKGDDAESLLRSIRALGMKLSIDDFGTGYSSLAYLKRFPIDELKIDRSFIRDLPADSDDAEIAATVIAMARNLKLQVVAEGVETREQADFLVEHGCAHCQGYLFSPAIPADEFEGLLAAQAHA